MSKITKEETILLGGFGSERKAQEESRDYMAANVFIRRRVFPDPRSYRLDVEMLEAKVAPWPDTRMHTPLNRYHLMLKIRASGEEAQVDDWFGIVKHRASAFEVPEIPKDTQPVPDALQEPGSEYCTCYPPNTPDLVRTLMATPAGLMCPRCGKCVAPKDIEASRAVEKLEPPMEVPDETEGSESV